MLELPDKKIVADVAVSVGRAWQKCGHSSRIGIVFILLIDAGVIKCLVCHECSANWTRTVKNVKIGGTSTTLPVTLFIMVMIIYGAKGLVACTRRGTVCTRHGTLTM